MMRREAFCAGAILVLPLDPILAQNAPGQTSRIVGIVVDSTHGSGLEGAEVLVSGVSSPVRTDSQGRFVIEGLSAGTYKIGDAGTGGDFVTAPEIASKKGSGTPIVNR